MFITLIYYRYVNFRNKPGGHWNDAYSFVRLHQPAITYGIHVFFSGAKVILGSKLNYFYVQLALFLYLFPFLGNNSRGLGVGGHDLATKSQILSHFEMCLADLIDTGMINSIGKPKNVIFVETQGVHFKNDYNFVFISLSL